MSLSLELYEESQLVFSIVSLIFPAVKTLLFPMASLVIRVSCIGILISYYIKYTCPEEYKGGLSY